MISEKMKIMIGNNEEDLRIFKCIFMRSIMSRGFTQKQYVKGVEG